MIQFERALDIALSVEPPAANRQEVEVTPLTSTESLVASRGLTTHIDILYKGVVKKSDANRALLQVFYFLSTDVEQFLKRSHNIARVLDPDGPEVDNSRAVAALVMAALMRGKRSHQTGVWLKGNAADKESEAMVRDLIDINRLDFFDLRKQGFRQAKNNLYYWRYCLEDVRYDPYIARLRQAIEESDHFLHEV